MIRIIAACFLCSLLFLSLFPQLITPYSPTEQTHNALLQSPNSQFLLGTDELGRDLLARTLFGARISLACALVSTLLAAILGISFGAYSGFKGGKIDGFMMRIVDVCYSIPDLLFFILLGIFFGRDFGGMVLALSAFSWLSIARLARGEILKYKKSSYVEAAQTIACSKFRIFFFHLLPQIQRPIQVTLLFKIPSVILAESTLSFLGLGLAPPHSSWGTLAGEAFSALQFYPHLIAVPCLFIFLTLVSFQILAQKLQ